MTKTKYKQTKIGKIPVGWNEEQIGEIIEIVGGGTPKTNVLKYWNGNINWFTPTELRKKYVDLSKRTITKSGLKASSARLLPHGTILFTTRATIGLASITKTECTTNQGFQSFLPNENYHTDYLYYWLIQNPHEFIRRASGSTFLEISKKDISKIKIPLPPLPEQQKIAKILSTWDKAIETQQKLIKQKQQLKKALMQQLLTGKKRFDGFEEEWKEVRLGEVVEFKNGKGHEGIIVKTGKYILVNSKFISSEGEVFKRINEALVPLFKGDITMVMSDVPNGKAIAKCFIIPEDNMYSLNQRICLLKPIDVNGIFLFYQVNRNKYFLKFDNGVGQTNLKKNEVLDCPIKIPTLKEQQKIASVLLSADKEIEKLENILEILQQQKKGLMQQLLTGQIRVEV